MLRKLSDRNVININLVFLNQVHEKVHRPFKGLQMHRIALGPCFFLHYQKKGLSTVMKISQIIRCAGTKIMCKIGVQIRTIKIRKL